MAETGTKVKQNQKGREDAKVEVANSISILDYATKNEMNILYEDSSIARIEAASGDLLTVFKDNNSWSSSTGEEEIKTYGNTIRFVAKMENLEWREAIDKLVEERGDYLSSSEYNAAYEKMYAINHQEPLVANARSTESRNLNNAERQKVKSISITDYARALGLPVEEINKGKVTIIKDPRFEGLLIYNSSNTWDWNSKFVHDGDSIKFAERIQNISREKAIESLTAFADTGKILDNNPEKETVEAPDEPVELSESKPEAINDRTIITENELETNQNEQHSKIRKTMTKEQLSELLSGYRRDIDVSAFDNPDLTPEQMRQLRLAKQNGINPEDFNEPSLSSNYMKEMRLSAQSGLDLSVFKDEKGSYIFTAAQAKEIRLGLLNGLNKGDISIFAKHEMDSEAMKEIRLGLQDGIEQMRNLGNGNYTAKDIHAIRMTLLVNHIMDAIKIHLRNLFDNVISFIKKSFVLTESIKQYDQVPVTSQNEVKNSENVDVEKTATFAFKDTLESVYEAMSDELQHLSLSEKKEAIISALRVVIDQAKENEITASTDMEKEKALDKAIDSFVEMKDEEALMKAAYESLEEEYVERFYQNEIDYSEEVYNFTQSVLGDVAIDNQHKEEILNRTLGVVFGDKTAAEWISHLPEVNSLESKNEPPKQKMMDMIQEEYESITVTEEIQMEVG